MNKPRLLDLFSGEGGAGMGYYNAGFIVTGVDNRNMARYPFTFVQADALEFLAEHFQEFDAIHASPPCQAYTKLWHRRKGEHPDLISETRAALEATGLPWIIENVPGAPLVDPVTLCGTMFNLRAVCQDGDTRYLRRHRLFESNVPIGAPRACRHAGLEALGVYGHGGARTDHYFGTRLGYLAMSDEASEAMGTWWMGSHAMSQAIPPVYTEHLGRQLLRTLEATA